MTGAAEGTQQQQRRGLPFFVADFGRSVANDISVRETQQRRAENLSRPKAAAASEVVFEEDDHGHEDEDDHEESLSDEAIDSHPDHDVRHICIRSPYLVRRAAAEAAAEAAGSTNAASSSSSSSFSSSSSSLSSSSSNSSTSSSSSMVGRAVMRQGDLVLAPSDQWPFATWGWSGSTALMRQMRDYSKHAQDHVSHSVSQSVSYLSSQAGRQ